MPIKAKTAPKIPIIIPAIDILSKYPMFFLEIIANNIPKQPNIRPNQGKKQNSTESPENTTEITEYSLLFCLFLIKREFSSCGVRLV